MMAFPNTSPAAKGVPAKDSRFRFQRDVLAGLNQQPKQLQSKYFYDKAGDALFQQIMAMPEYYLTRSELEIFRDNTADLAAAIGADRTPFDLIELGAGDAMKSSFLLQYLVSQQRQFTYVPIDISGNILQQLDQRLRDEMPGLDVVCLEGEYFDMLKVASALSSRRKVVMCLGGNIGNMERDDVMAFCRELRRNLRAGDMALIGFDLKKNPRMILDAYNDKAGITARFNLNLLSRINFELGANFQLYQFEHYQCYDPAEGACRSYLVSLCEQVVNIAGRNIAFERNETIYMEVSQKFSPADISLLAVSAGFVPHVLLHDSQQYFTDAIWIAK